MPPDTTQPTTMASGSTTRPFHHGMGGGAGTGGGGGGSADHSHGEVWVQDGNFVRPVEEVRLGVTDTVNTEVVSGDLKETDNVVVGENLPGTANADDAKNPFAPSFRGTRGGGTGGGRSR